MVLLKRFSAGGKETKMESQRAADLAFLRSYAESQGSSRKAAILLAVEALAAAPLGQPKEDPPPAPAEE